MRDCKLLCCFGACFFAHANMQHIDIFCVSSHSCAYLQIAFWIILTHIILIIRHLQCLEPRAFNSNPELIVKINPPKKGNRPSIKPKYAVSLKLPIPPMKLWANVRPGRMYIYIYIYIYTHRSKSECPLVISCAHTQPLLQITGTYNHWRANRVCHVGRQNLSRVGTVQDNMR